MTRLSAMDNHIYMRGKMKRGFSLVELMIIVAVLGILAAIVVPQFQSHATQAKEAVAKDSLRILRSAIELYAARHSGVAPGYEDDDPATAPSSLNFCEQLIENRYLLKMPKNPFNKLSTMQLIGNSEAFPSAATGDYGWIYQPAIKTIRLDWPGADKDGIAYIEY